MNRKRSTIYGITGILLAIGICTLLIVFRPKAQKKAFEAKDPLVEVEVVTSGDLHLTLESDGAVQAKTETFLNAEVDGKVEYVSSLFADGKRFRKGDLLLQLDKSDLELAVANAEVDLSTAKTNYERENFESKVAKEEWEALEETDPSDLALRKPQLAQAKASLQAAQVRLEKAKRDLARTQIVAPYDGVVRLRSVDLGQLVRRGEKLGEIYASDIFEVTLPIQQGEIKFLNLIQLASPRTQRAEQRERNSQHEVRFSIPSMGEKASWEGRLVRLSGEIDPKTRFLSLIAEVDNPLQLSQDGETLPLLPGSFVKAEIQGKFYKNVSVIPRSALKNGNQIYVVNSENKVEIREVSPLQKREAEVLLEKGVRAGEHVIVSHLKIVTDGMKVRTKEVVENASESA